jgi:hypothetical protein
MDEASITVNGITYRPQPPPPQPQAEDEEGASPPAQRGNDQPGSTGNALSSMAAVCSQFQKHAGDALRRSAQAGFFGGFVPGRAAVPGPLKGGARGVFAGQPSSPALRLPLGHL